MPNPRIYLAFANNLEEDNFLPLLQEEKKAIYDTLIEGDKKSYYRLDHTELAKADEICNYLIKFKNDVIIFHFGGHAEASKLMMSNETSDAQGIAEMLVQQKNLKLVFLNGCSTKDQVAFLLEKVPAVIATSSKIPDENAKLFAATFYKALFDEHSLNEAFGMAAGLVKAKGLELGMFRDIADQPEAEKSEEFPWGLYTKSDEVLDWKLPKEPMVKEVIIRGASDKYNYENGPINKKLFDTLIEVLTPVGPKLGIAFQNNFRLDQHTVINAFPSPIGEQLRKLSSMNDPASDNKGRLKQLVNTYSILVDFISFALIGNLWDFKVKNEALAIPKETLDEIQNFLTLGKDNVATYYNNNLLKKVIKSYLDLKIIKDDDCFFAEDMPPLVEAFQSDEDFMNDCEFMEAMQLELTKLEDNPSEEIESFCVQAEEHLCNIFRHLWFSAKYKMNAIKKISVRTSRNKSEKHKYRHHQVELYAVMAGTIDEVKDYEGIHAANHSVILLKDSTNVESFINFSPFVIDENALLNIEKSKVFFFNYYDKEENKLYYKLIKDPRPENQLVLPYKMDSNREAALKIDSKLVKEAFNGVQNQLDDFCNLMFGKPLKEL